MAETIHPFGRKNRQVAYIDPALCTGCGYCARFCTTKCIHQNPDGTYYVDQDFCIACRSCKANCTFGAVTILQPQQEA